ncbi:MAG: NifB/NifX family molybdenum-iron cluster-binding protein [Candidatus Sabulitectum sp.]|nr:NifB/NifX family molybdenum-iron cluster-binding protein [Candidatus Sabulitectum sp.]
MKIAIASSGNTLESPVDGRFGRAPGFIVYDTDNDTFTIADNRQNLNAAQGAGIQAAQNVAETGAGAVIAPNFGPKAFSVLKAAGIKALISNAATVQDVIDEYKSGKLSESSSANVQGHW